MSTAISSTTLIAGRKTRGTDRSLPVAHISFSILYFTAITWKRVFFFFFLFFLKSVRLGGLLPLSGACGHEQSILLRFAEGLNDPPQWSQLVVSWDFFSSELKWPHEQKKSAVGSQRAVFNLILSDGCQSWYQSTWRSGHWSRAATTDCFNLVWLYYVDSFLNIATHVHFALW